MTIEIFRKVFRHAAQPGRDITTGKDFVDEVTLLLLLPDGSCFAGELSFRWHDTGLDAQPVPRMEVWDEGWAVLQKVPELSAILAAVGNPHYGLRPIQPAHLCDLLTQIGFESSPSNQPQGCAA